MDYNDLIKQRQGDFDSAVEYATKEASAIRTGRANPEMVAELKVIYNGTDVRMKEIAAISTPDARSLLIQPWDPSALKGIEKAIVDSQLGMAPVVDGKSVRLTVPSLTEERRKEFVRLLNQKMEEARIKVRQTREDVLKKMKNEDYREDDVRRGRDELQKVVDDANGRIEKLMEQKEQELMTS